MRRIELIRDDRGATIVIIALAMVALIGLVGLAVDTGAIFAERRELSRGADAAALAVAEDCATGVACTTAEATVTADGYADANADDGAAAIQSLTIDLGAQTVHVTTKTIDPADGTDRFKLFFMRVLGIDSTTVTADATAIWGYPSLAAAFPLIISECEWPGVAASTEANQITILFHSGGQNDPDDCAAQAGQDEDGDGRLPGGFGWLETDGNCIGELQDGDRVAEDPGASASTGCSAQELYDLMFEKTVPVPYFDDVMGLGNNGSYHVKGVGAFHVTGYNFGGQYKTPDAASAPCSGDDRCLRGYFDPDVVFEGPLGGTYRGLIVVKLIA
jgi:Flp pilus assembly protein TadG